MDVPSLQYNSYSDIDIINGLLNKGLTQQQYHGENNHLGNTIVKPTVINNHILPFNNSQDDVVGDYGQIIPIDEPEKQSTPIDKLLDSNKKKYVNSNGTNGTIEMNEFNSFVEVLTNDYIGSFYFASLTVIGLYILFKMIKK
uniref:Uncharacterized protein n=1 Tax=viral metagenome TaxID=1070528 RepID=A0A6C0DS59_9ZZZZ